MRLKEKTKKRFQDTGSISFINRILLHLSRFRYLEKQDSLLFSDKYQFMSCF